MSTAVSATSSTLDVRAPECMICAGSAQPLYKPCRCDIVIHRECLDRLVTVPTHSHSCAVCKHPYDIRVVRRRVACVASDMPRYAICLFAAAYVVTGASLYGLYTLVEHSRSVDAGAAAVLSGVTTLLSCACVAAHLVALKNYASCCVASLRVESEKRVEVSRVVVDREVHLAEVV